MKESKAVYVTRRDIRDNRLRRDFQLYNNIITRNINRSGSADVGVQFDSRKDNLIVCTCRKQWSLKRHHEPRFFSPSPKQIFTYHRSRSFTEIGVGSVKALQKRKVKRVYLPETDDRGVGNEDLSSFIRKPKIARGYGYYDQKKTSSKCVGHAFEATLQYVVSAKVSPINNTRSGATSPWNPTAGTYAKNALAGSGTINRQLASATTGMDAKEVEVVQESVAKTVETVKATVNDVKESEDKKGKVDGVTKMDNEKSFSSDSLVERVHNLDQPSEYKASVDPMENTLEREYRKMFCSKSRDKKKESNTDKPAIPEKSTSLFRKRFTALRRSLGKKDSKGAVGNKVSQGSVASVRDVSVTSDPPSLEGRSFSNTEPFAAQEQTVARTNHPKASYKKSSYVSKTKQGISKNWSGCNKTDTIDSDYATGVKGMFKLWGKKFNLEESVHKKETPNDSFDSKVEKNESVEPESTAEKVPEKKKDGKKFFFFKRKKSKDTKDNKDQNYKPKKVTTGRCEVRDGLTIKIGAASNSPTPSRKKSTDRNHSSYEEMLRTAWLMKFLTTPIESRNSVKIRWNNKMYATSSSTIFELMENVYKDTGVVLKSKSEIMSDASSSFYKSYTKQNVNFIQNVEAWMVPRTIPDRPPPVIIAENKVTDEDTNDDTNDEVENNNMAVTISDQKWFIDKSKAFAHKIEVVLHSNNVVQLGNQNYSSEYLRIDIPKGFFSDVSDEKSSSDEHTPAQVHTSDEQVYNIVEYDNAKFSNDVNGSKDSGDFRTGDREPKDIKVTISVKDGASKESKILETIIKRPPTHRDVVIQGSNVYIPKKCDVIGVGIITQRDIRELKRPILRVIDYESEDESNHSILDKKECNFAESYLQEYYKHLQPIGSEMFSWCVSDSHLRCCSYDSYISPNGDGTRSCPNIYEDYVPGNSNCTSDCSQIQSYAVEEVKKGRKEKKPKKPKPSRSSNKNDEVPLPTKVLPKDSLEVLKSRKVYAIEKKKWDNECPQLSTPSTDTCGIQKFSSRKCCRPKKPTCPKKVNLPDCAEICALKQKMSDTQPAAGILVFGGCKKDPCEKKNLRVNPKPCDIPDVIPPCKKVPSCCKNSPPCTPPPCASPPKPPCQPKPPCEKPKPKCSSCSPKPPCSPSPPCSPKQSCSPSPPCSPKPPCSPSPPCSPKKSCSPDPSCHSMSPCPDPPCRHRPPCYVRCSKKPPCNTIPPCSTPPCCKAPKLPSGVCGAGSGKKKIPCPATLIPTSNCPKGKDGCIYECDTPPCRKVSSEYPWPMKSPCMESVSIVGSSQSVYMHTGSTTCDCRRGRAYDNCSGSCPSRSKSVPTCGSSRSNSGCYGSAGKIDYATVPQPQVISIESLKSCAPRHPTPCDNQLKNSGFISLKKPLVHLDNSHRGCSGRGYHTRPHCGRDRIPDAPLCPPEPETCPVTLPKAPPTPCKCPPSPPKSASACSIPKCSHTVLCTKPSSRPKKPKPSSKKSPCATPPKCPSPPPCSTPPCCRSPPKCPHKPPCPPPRAKCPPCPPRAKCPHSPPCTPPRSPPSPRKCISCSSPPKCPPPKPKCPPPPCPPPKRPKCPPSPPKCPPRPPSPPKCPHTPPKCPLCFPSEPKCPHPPPKCPLCFPSTPTCPPAPPKCPPSPPICPPSPPKCPPSPPKCPSPPRRPPSPPKCPPSPPRAPSPTPCPPTRRSCHSDCPVQGGYVVPQIPCPSPPPPPRKCPSGPPRIDCPKTCPTKALMQGIHLRKAPGPPKSSCSQEFIDDQCDTDLILLGLDTKCSDKGSNVRGMKIQDDDGQTIVERKDYTCHRNYISNSPSERATPFIDTVYKNSATVTVNEMASVERAKEVKSKSDTSISNIIEINFRLRVTQGDKTTEINIENEDEGQRKENKTRTKQVYVMKNEQSTEEINANNDVNIRILIKNFKSYDTKKKAVDVDEFSNKISKKFNTVSTGYSTDCNIDNPDGAFSIHRATIDLTTSGEKPKALSQHSGMINKRKSKSLPQLQVEIVPEELNENVSLRRQEIEEHISSKIQQQNNASKHDLEQHAISNAQELIAKVSVKPEINLSVSHKENKPEIIERHSSEPIMKLDTEQAKTDKVQSQHLKVPSSRQDVDVVRLYKYDAPLSMTDTEDKDNSLYNKTSDEPTDIGNKTSDERTYTDYGKTSEEADSDTKTSDVLVVEKIPSDDPQIDLKKSKKEEKKEMLKQVFENANYLQKPKTRNRIQKLKDILKSILTSDSEPDVIQDKSEEEYKSVTQIYDTADPEVSNQSMFKPPYPTTDNSCSGKETDLSEDNEAKPCVCSTFAQRLNTEGGCCCRRKILNDQEISCNLMNESDLDDIMGASAEFADAVTQNSRHQSSMRFRKSFNQTISTVASKKETVHKLNSKVTEVISVPSKKSAKKFPPPANNTQEYEMRILNTKTKLGISEEDKIVFLEARSTRMRENRTRRKRDKYFNDADVLQMYETKKAVLEIYAEKTVTDNGEKVVAKLPKFVYDRENELYECYGGETYRNVYKKNFVMMSIGR